jgi:periplasmic protein TonB
MKIELIQPVDGPLTDENSKPISSNQFPAEQNSVPWNDLVFEKRNRDYGAYVLRGSYGRNVAVGLIVTLLATLLIFFLPVILDKFFADIDADKPAPRKLVYTELSAPPPIDKPKPLPPVLQLPKLQKVIKFVPPKVVKEDVVEAAPTIEEIKANDVAAVAIEGPTEVVFDEPVAEITIEDDNEIFTVVEQAPEFAGGYDALMAWVKQHMVYPANARRMGMEGTVYLSFVVGKDGVIRDVSVLKGFMRECDNEAMRVVNLMPKWKPGKQNGHPVNVRFTLPLKFRMS